MAFPMNAHLRTNSILDRLDRLSPWAFTGSLYLARWVIIIPISYALQELGVVSGKMTFDGSAIMLFFGFIFLSPLVETVLECLAPYWLLRKAQRIPAGKRPWAFIAVSAGIMALMHLSAWPSAILPSLVTGGFLAYTYSHFALCGAGPAMLHTCVFHAAINIIGWLLIFAF
jgi:hypothetical protein